VRFPVRFATALAAAFARDQDNLARAFRGLSDDGVANLGRELLQGLDLAARLSGDRTAWAFACNRIPWPYVRVGAAELQARIDAWTAPAGRQAAPGRRQLARLAIRLLRAGEPGAKVLAQLDAANATLAAPITAEAVGDVARWAAAEVRRLPRAS
jgi:hypothetical protein